MSFSLEGFIGHGNGWSSFGDGAEEDSTPADGVLLFTEEGRQVELFQYVRCELETKRYWF